MNDIYEINYIFILLYSLQKIYILSRTIKMFKGYKQEQVLDTPSENCTIYRASKNGKLYLMHEFEGLNQSDQYSFKIRKKLKCSHMVDIVEEFEEKDYKFFISEWIEMDLLKLIWSRNNHVLQLNQALQYFARIIEVLDEFHCNKLVYRNVRPEKIRVKDSEPYFYDYSMSQFMKRRERMFDIVGQKHYLAPQFFSEDGYSIEVDIWAAGVLLFYMLVNQYPFKFKSEDEASFKQQFIEKCSNGFKFKEVIQENKNNIPPIKGNKNLEDLFKKIFTINPSKRISISEIKQLSLFQSFFPEQVDQQMMEAIQQHGREESVFLSYMNKFPCSKELHKEEIILDFIEHTAQSFILDCSETYSQQLRYKAQFSILKVGIMKANILLDIFYGKRQPNFKIDINEWNSIRNSSTVTVIKQKLERKKKILNMLYKNAFMNVQEFKESLFKIEIPLNFQEIKLQYRGILSQMFEIGRKGLAKTKGDRKICRKLTENLVKVIIFFLVNRLFEKEETIKEDFAEYFSWSKKKDLEDLQEWIETEQLSNLKVFMKSVTAKYL